MKRPRKKKPKNLTLSDDVEAKGEHIAKDMDASFSHMVSTLIIEECKRRGLSCPPTADAGHSAPAAEVLAALRRARRRQSPKDRK